MSLSVAVNHLQVYMYSVGEGSGGHYANWLLKCSQHLSRYSWATKSQLQAILSTSLTLIVNLSHQSGCLQVYLFNNNVDGLKCIAHQSNALRCHWFPLTNNPTLSIFLQPRSRLVTNDCLAKNNNSLSLCFVQFWLCGWYSTAEKFLDQYITEASHTL